MVMVDTKEGDGGQFFPTIVSTIKCIKYINCSI